jgi:hypothetical protein
MVTIVTICSHDMRFSKLIKLAMIIFMASLILSESGMPEHEVSFSVYSKFRDLGL